MRLWLERIFVVLGALAIGLAALNAVGSLWTAAVGDLVLGLVFLALALVLSRFATG